MLRWVAIALALVLAGCTDPAPPRVEPPVGTGEAECPPQNARAIAIPFRANESASDDGRGAGLHRLSRNEFLWVYANYTDTLREDRVTRVNAVQVARDAEGMVHVCTRVDLAAPVDVDAERESYVVAVRLTAGAPLPEGPLRVVVNWVAGCPCEPLPRGNMTAQFDG